MNCTYGEFGFCVTEILQKYRKPVRAFETDGGGGGGTNRFSNRHPGTCLLPACPGTMTIRARSFYTLDGYTTVYGKLAHV